MENPFLEDISKHSRAKDLFKNRDQPRRWRCLKIPDRYQVVCELSILRLGKRKRVFSLYSESKKESTIEKRKNRQSTDAKFFVCQSVNGQ